MSLRDTPARRCVLALMPRFCSEYGRSQSSGIPSIKSLGKALLRSVSVCFQRLPPRGAAQRSSTERDRQRPDQPIHHDPVAASSGKPPERHPEGLHGPVSIHRSGSVPVVLFPAHLERNAPSLAPPPSRGAAVSRRSETLMDLSRKLPQLQQADSATWQIGNKSCKGVISRGFCQAFYSLHPTAAAGDSLSVGKRRSVSP